MRCSVETLSYEDTGSASNIVFTYSFVICLNSFVASHKSECSKAAIKSPVFFSLDKFSFTETPAGMCADNLTYLINYFDTDIFHTINSIFI